MRVVNEWLFAMFEAFAPALAALFIIGMCIVFSVQSCNDDKAERACLRHGQTWSCKHTGEQSCTTVVNNGVGTTSCEPVTGCWCTP